MSAESPLQSQMPHHWRSVEEQSGAAVFPADLQAAEQVDSPGTDGLLSQLSLSRRSFLQLLGASMAVGGLSSLGGCIRKPVEKILPYSKRPEEIVPGKPLYFATAMQTGGSVVGVLAESHEGRPTRLDGHPEHPMSLGGSHPWVQGAIWELYDPDRSQKPRHKGHVTHAADVSSFLKDHFSAFRKTSGAGLALLLPHRPSPTFRSLLQELKRIYPLAGLYLHDHAYPWNQKTGLTLAGISHTTDMVHDLRQAQVIVALDADLFGTERDAIFMAKAFADGRRLARPSQDMNRLYTVEAQFSTTGAMADHRLRMQSQEVGFFLRALGTELIRLGLTLPPEADDMRTMLTHASIRADWRKWVSALAKDLLHHQGRSVLAVGERQPAWVHAMAYGINVALGNVGSTVRLVSDADAPNLQPLSALVRHMNQGAIKTLTIIDSNPIYSAPVDLGFGDALKRVGTVIHHGTFWDETAEQATWHIPANHFLEGWGDLRASDGTISIQQPLIAPLYDTWSELEFLSQVLGKPLRGYELVYGYWMRRVGGLRFDNAWRKWIHDGIVTTGVLGTEVMRPQWSQIAKAVRTSSPKPSPGLEINFYLDSSVYDGRYANNGWLQELPDPMTKLTWDNAVCMNPSTAKTSGIHSGDMVQITWGGKTFSMAAFVTPGVADNVIILPLGYGRTSGGRFAQGVGFNTYLLRTFHAPYFGTGAVIQKGEGKYALASTQEHGRMEPWPGSKPRPLVREHTHAGYQKNPNFVQDYEVMPKEKIRSLWTDPHPRTAQQWGMVIDLNTCTGCNACTIACQTENNIPLVGKDRVLNGRELHWIRLDRYYTGDVDNPQAVMQPVTCMQCENAPCESVCPVAATTHSPEGLNDMAYNRCIGTRYCSNNCPFKVRRFNFFNYGREMDDAVPLTRMQRNPDVSVRFRGVMEKCTYCVQRINAAKIENKKKGQDRVPDGEIVPACAQACPTKAIVFGDISDPKSQVTRLRSHERNYGLLMEMNLQPRTTYLAKIRNPNPELM